MWPPAMLRFFRVNWGAVARHVAAALDLEGTHFSCDKQLPIGRFSVPSSPVRSNIRDFYFTHRPTTHTCSNSYLHIHPRRQTWALEDSRELAVFSFLFLPPLSSFFFFLFSFFFFSSLLFREKEKKRKSRGLRPRGCNTAESHPRPRNRKQHHSRCPVVSPVLHKPSGGTKGLLCRAYVSRHPYRWWLPDLRDGAGTTDERKEERKQKQASKQDTARETRNK